MSVWQTVKGAAEALTGSGRPGSQDLKSLVRPGEPELFRFTDDGATPNNPRLPLVLYRSAVQLKAGLDPAAIFEDLFAAHGWTDSWRDGIYDFLHFHTHRHEVLGIARGDARVRLGGADGKSVSVHAGDVIVLPAGTGHQRASAGDDLLVVGAYPKSSGAYDQPQPKEADHQQARAAIAAVPAPDADPVYGREGPLVSLWR